MLTNKLVLVEKVLLNFFFFFAFLIFQKLHWVATLR